MAGYYEKMPSGKYRLFASGGTGGDGKRRRFSRTVEASSDREAEKLLAAFVAEVNGKTFVEPSKLTFAAFAERWLRDCGQVRLAPKTLHRYQEILGRVTQSLGHLKLEQVKPMHLVEFYNQLREEGVRQDGKPGKLAESSVLYHHRVISSLLNDAVKWGLIPFNPASRVDPPKARTKQAACYDIEQTAMLLAALDEEPLQYKMMVVLALTLGLRRGELMGLEWQDVSFERNTIEVCRTSQYLKERGIFTKQPKTETSSRLISVPASVMALLKQYRAQQNEQRLKVGDLWQGSDRLFTTWDGRPMHPDTISSWFRNFLKRHNLPHIKFHALRHTSATLLIAEGVPLKNVSSRLGHANTRTTADIYAHALRSVDQEAAEKMDRIITTGSRKEQI